MSPATNTTPLIALDAVVLDSETTGLDPTNARIVEIAAVRLTAGRIDAAASFRRLVNPRIPIPPDSTRIHSIDDAAVASEPGFAEIWPDLLAYLGSSVVIGHTLGFDLAVLKRECERAGLTWVRPRTLDTRLLAAVAQPDLAGFSLENLTAWLNVEVADRHTALGDSITTARVFLALLPKLREGNIRTLAEAEQACRSLTDVLEEQHRAGWVEAVEAPSRTDAERTLQRIDSYPYRHRIRDLMSAPPKLIAPDMTVGEALKSMAGGRVSSLFVAAPEDRDNLRPTNTGIVTERDIMRALMNFGADGLSVEVSKIMNRPLMAVPGDAFVYRAIGRMSRLRVRHLGVVDDAGRVVGALSARDLLRLRAEEAIELGDEIDEAVDVPALGRAWAKLPHVAASLRAEGLTGRDIAAVISRELGALSRRAAALAEQMMTEAGRGGPPCPYAFAVLGSAGRGESLLAMDQDNALVFADGEPGGPEDRWFEEMGAHAAAILHEVGVPLCKGGVMAKNPQWRGSIATWKARIADWIRRSSPADLLSVDIFFDFRAVHGDAALANTVWLAGFEAAKGEAGFAKLLAEAAGSVEQGLGMFGRFRTENGWIDLKKTGLFGIVTAARVLAIRHNIVERGTVARLSGIKALGIGGGTDLDRLAEAQATFLDLISDQQISDVQQGRPASNRVLVKRLDEGDRERLRNALRAVGHLDDLTRDLLFRD